MATMVLPCAMFCACGDDDEEDVKINSDQPSSVALLTDVEAEKYIDSDYIPTSEDITKTWAGEYQGWDANQASDNHVGNTKIRRQLILQPNGRYENIIQGVILEGKDDYYNFEKEKGTYSYNQRSKTITYSVESDSILDYRMQILEFYAGKKYYSHTDKTYTEKVDFSTEKDGQRSWITHDTYLQSLTNKTINIAFMMVPNVNK